MQRDIQKLQACEPENKYLTANKKLSIKQLGLGQRLRESEDLLKVRSMSQFNTNRDLLMRIDQAKKLLDDQALAEARPDVKQKITDIHAKLYKLKVKLAYSERLSSMMLGSTSLLPLKEPESRHSSAIQDDEQVQLLSGRE